MKRVFDLSVVLLLSVMMVLPMLLIAVAVRMSSKGQVLYWSDRAGRGNKIFRMPKFRTMQVNTPAMATDQMTNPDTFLSPIGGPSSYQSG